MRTLGTLILLSAAAFAQTPTAVQNPAAPATVSVQPTKTATAHKPSPNGVKTTGATAPSVKPAVSVKVVPAAKPATSTQKTASTKPAISTVKTASVAASGKAAAPNQKATISGKALAVNSAAKPVSEGSKVNATPAQASAAKPVSAGPKAVPATKGAPVVGVLVKPAAAPVGKGGQKPSVAQVMPKPANAKSIAVKPVAHVKVATSHTKPVMASVAVGSKPAPSVQENKPAENKKPSEEVRAAGWRDPFVSPVVAMGATGSGCSAGKRCLTIDQIALKGVVKSESGMIAVVTNSLDKAYFLRENDPVFNGYVVKITGDSIIFKETFHDRLGKALTRDVTKSITRPVA